ncbi:hypothetical protein B9Z55_001593 [Caenorhabditis nigoni]|uniref:Uncharacterized protein n=1 Tax=Caenorhabditis nigoni TaxID=1611254 RepID=A0A2G5VGE9_9PELO|nr:hypothetical protein B9Z55_001593 [Caenorhabditis nigoni]
MKRTTNDQQGSFQSDYFLTQLSNFTEAKFSLFEHAPANERRDRFRNHIERDEMPLINFRSRPFLFNGIWVKVFGTMNSESLDGRVRFERFQQVEEEPIGLTDAEIAALRRDGLNI